MAVSLGNINGDSVCLVTAVAVMNSGQFAQTDDGRIGIVQNMKPVAIGQDASLATAGEARGTSAATMSAGAVVAVHIAKQTIVAAGTAGSVAAGTLKYDVTSGGPATFSLNEFPRGTVSIGASTAAAGSTYADAGALPAGTASLYPTTAADDTKGVIIDVADQVYGRTIRIGNGVSNKILKVYGPAGAVINGAAANAAFSSASGKGVTITCLSASGNTWLAE